MRIFMLALRGWIAIMLLRFGLVVLRCAQRLAPDIYGGYLHVIVNWRPYESHRLQASEAQERRPTLH